MDIAHPAVYLFGAGATRGAFEKDSLPPPVDSDFFEIAGHIKGHGTQMLVAKVLKDVWTLYGTTSGIGLEYYYRDIETRKQIGSFAKASNKPKNWQKRQHELDELIRRVIIQTTCQEIDGHYKPIPRYAHTKILGYLDRRDTILTFNYDLVIEESFGKNPIWSPRQGYGVDISGITSEWANNWFNTKEKDSHDLSAISILKLHGSINWDQYSNGGLKLKDRPFALRKKKKAVIPESVSILAPGWTKAIHKNPYKKLWYQARLALENCSSVVVLGYSLPETDLLAKALFSEVVRHRARSKLWIKQLHLCDPSDAVNRRLVELFRPTLNSSSRIFHSKSLRDFAKLG